MSIFSHPQLDFYLFEFLDPQSLINLFYTNKHYNEKIKLYINSKMDKNKFFNYTCYYNDLYLSKYLYNNYILKYNKYDLFICACKNNSINTAKWLNNINCYFKNKSFVKKLLNNLSLY